MSDELKREAVFLYVTHNFSRLKATIYPYKLQKDALLRTENPVFKEEVERQFKNLVRSIILNAAALDLQLNAEDILTFVEDIDVDKFTEEDPTKV